jgi:hypothetical protein
MKAFPSCEGGTAEEGICMWRTDSTLSAVCMQRPSVAVFQVPFRDIIAVCCSSDCVSRDGFVLVQPCHPII